MSPCDTTSVRSFQPRIVETAPLAPVRTWQQGPLTGILLVAGGGAIGTLLAVTTGNGILVIVLGTLLCGPGLAMIVMSRLARKETIPVEIEPSWDLYPDRLVRRCGDETESILLADIVETYCDHSTEVEAPPVYRLITKGRHQHLIDSAVDHHTELGDEVLARVNQRVLAEAKSTLDGGGKATFGLISLNDECLRHGTREFRWDEIKKLEFRVIESLGTRLQFVGTLNTDTGTSSIIQSMDKIPNAGAFEQLIRGTPLFTE